MPDDSINLIGETSYRNVKNKFGIKIDDRRRHLYVIGKTGMGKTALLKNMVVQDIRNGLGLGFVDPHGEAAEELLRFIPKSRIKDVVYINPADIEHPVSFNVMEEVAVELRHLVAAGLMDVFKKIWPDVWSARMEYILHNCILALLEYPGATLLGVNRMLSDENYRAKVVSVLTDPVVKAFWAQEFARYSQRYEVEATAAIQNKIGQFISSPLIRNLIGQKTSTVDMRSVMDEGKILILNLSKGRIGEESARLLGGLLITKLQLAAMSRVDIPEDARRDFVLYVDEFQNFATESFANILSEARKYRLDLVLAHQYITQMEEPVRDAVFGNVGTMLCFRVGADDAEFLEKEFFPEFVMGDLVNLPKYHIYLKLMVDGVTTRPFSATTLYPIAKPEKDFADDIIEYSRKKYSCNRAEVEEAIAEWTGGFVIKPAPAKSNVEMYPMKCFLCGQESRVPFKPDPNKPVYCKPCLKKIEQQRQERAEKSKNITSNQQPKKMDQVKGLFEREKQRVAPSVEAKRTETPQTEKTLSLNELETKNIVSFSKKGNNHNNKKKEVNKEELKSALRDFLGRPEAKQRIADSKESVSGQDRGVTPRGEPTVKRGTISPGQTVRF